MSGVTVEIARQGTHWVLKLYVDGEVDSGTVVACRQGLAPLVRGLEAAEAKIRAVSATTERAVVDSPPTVTVVMPSGRELTFALTSLQDTLA